MPSSVPYYGEAETANEKDVDWGVTSLEDFPWQGYPGQGIANPTGPVGPIVRRQVIGMAVYRPAAQLGEEYGAMETDRGKTRGKFTELVFDLKHDAWVIPNLSHGILLIVDAEENIGTPSLKVEVVENQTVEPEVTAVTAAPAAISIAVGQQARPQVTVTGQGKFDKGWTAMSSDVTKASVNESGVITGMAAGTATITYKSVGDPTKTATVTVTVTAPADA